MNRPESKLTPEFISKVAELYRDMETAYDRIAAQLNFSCSGCPDNCCDSFFLHHTYTEWAYLWHGLGSLDEETFQKVSEKAAEYVAASEAALASGERPTHMCPLNAEGLCVLYPYRAMICRLHGVPATFTRPDSRKFDFPGCFRCQEICAGQENIPVLDRTGFFQRLVDLELELLGHRRNSMTRMKQTIAQMIVKGPPDL